MNYGDFDRRTSSRSRGRRLSREAELSPMQCLKSLGFSSGVTATFATAGMFDDAEGMTFASQAGEATQRKTPDEGRGTLLRPVDRRGSLPDYEAGYEDGMSGADIAPEFADPYADEDMMTPKEGNYSPPEQRSSRSRRKRR